MTHSCHKSRLARTICAVNLIKQNGFDVCELCTSALGQQATGTSYIIAVTLQTSPEHQEDGVKFVAKRVVCTESAERWSCSNTAIRTSTHEPPLVIGDLVRSVVGLNTPLFWLRTVTRNGNMSTHAV